MASYVKHTWGYGEEVQPDDVNRWEKGIDDAITETTNLGKNKVDKVTGKGLSTNDYTTEEKTKLSGIATGANKTTIADNLTTTAKGSALDASQGKVLADRLSTVSSDTTVQNASGTSLVLDTAEGGIRLNEIVGKTYKWNQMFDGSMNRLIANTGKQMVELISSSNASKVTLNAHNEGSSAMVDNVVYVAKTQIKNFNENHKYYVRVIAIENPNKLSLHLSTDTSVLDRKIIESFSSSVVFSYIYANNPNGLTTTITLQVIAIDLTSIFGADKEPSTVAEFESWLATVGRTGYQPYDTGSVHSVGSGYGCVDLGELDVTKNASGYFIIPKSDFTGIDDEALLYCPIYSYVGTSSAYIKDNMQMYIGTVNIGFRNDSCNTIDEFKSAMKGVYLTYELAEGASASNYAMVVKESGGKNLCNFTSDGTMMPLPHTLPAGTYTLSADTSSNASIGFRMSKTTSTSADSTVVSSVASNNHVVMTINTNHESNYVNLSGSTLSNIQIEKGSVATPYVPYSAKSFPIQLGSTPLCGIGSVEEKVFKQNGKWNRDKKYKLVDLGTLNWSYHSSSASFYSALNDSKIGVAEQKPNFGIDKYSVYPSRGFSSLTDKTITLITGSSTLSIKDTSYTDASAFKASLNGVILTYETNTPTTELLPNQSDCYEFESYTDKTYIETADGLATMDVDYGKSDLVATALDGQRLGYKANA